MLGEQSGEAIGKARNFAAKRLECGRRLEQKQSVLDRRAL